MHLGEVFWGDPNVAASTKLLVFEEPQNLVSILASAASSQRHKRSWQHTLQDHEREASARQRKAGTEADVRTWLAELKHRRNTRGRLVANAKQFEAVAVVAERVIEELRNQANGNSDAGDPLRRLLHGGPGSGKSHVIKLVRELFEKVLQWQIGMDFHIVALQLVMADLLGGDTIHHACGIPVFGKQDQNEERGFQKQMDVAKRVLNWRWLIIDEISMVSAKLLAELDLKLRNTVRRIGTQKVGADAKDRPFGGLNVLCSGDFWQLDPPEGGFLGDIPAMYMQAARQYTLAPSIAHGQALFWSGAQGGMQGISELEECERCPDPWLREVQV